MGTKLLTLTMLHSSCKHQQGECTAHRPLSKVAKLAATGVRPRGCLAWVCKALTCVPHFSKLFLCMSNFYDPKLFFLMHIISKTLHFYFQSFVYWFSFLALLPSGRPWSVNRLSILDPVFNHLAGNILNRSIF